MTSHLDIFSYNIHKGFSFSRRFVLRSIRDMIREVHAEVVFLQEVQGDHSKLAQTIPEWPGPQLEFLADSVWPHFAYGKNAVYQKGHHGNAILSKYPITFSENISLTNNRFEQRGLLHAVCDWHGSPLHLMCCHLDLTENGRVKQFLKIVERVKSHVPPSERLILAGDFNDWTQKATPIFSKQLDLKEAFVEATGAHAQSFPAGYPFLPLDRIYIRGFVPQSVRCHSEVPWNALSDHCAIETRLQTL